MKKPTTDRAIRNESLWGNCFLRGKFKKKWKLWCQDRGIYQIKDFLNLDHLISNEQFVARFGVHPPTGMLQSFTNMVPPEWWDKLFPINQAPPQGALYVPEGEDKRINIHSLSTKKFYSLLESKKKEPLSCAKRWERVYGDNILHSPLRWRHWHLLPYKVSHSVQLPNFMFRIAYHIIPTQLYLHRICVVDLEICNACQRRDDLLHFLLECPEVKYFWDSLATWMDNNTHIMNFPEDISEEEFLLGTTTTNASHYLFNFVTSS